MNELIETLKGFEPSECPFENLVDQLAIVCAQNFDKVTRDDWTKATERVLHAFYGSAT